MEKITFSRPYAATQRPYTAMRTAAEQAQQAVQAQAPEPEGIASAAEQPGAANPLAAAQLARQRAFSAFSESVSATASSAAPGAAQAAGIAAQPANPAVQTAGPANPAVQAAQAANAGVQAAGPANPAVQTAQPASPGAQAANAAANPTNPANPAFDAEALHEALTQADDEVKSLMDMMEQARKKAQETREKLKLPKNSARYGYAAIEAFARLSRARSQAQVSSAAGYARRQLGEMQTALRKDPQNAGRIRAAIRQLQSAVTRASRKKRDLEQDRIDRARRARAEKERRPGRAKRIEQELRRKQAVRRICDAGYVNNAVIDMVQQEHIEQTRAEQRAQLERIAGLGGSSADAAQAAYAAGAAYSGEAAAAAAPMPEIRLEG